MQGETETKRSMNRSDIEEMVDTVLKAVGIAMGIAVTVLAVLGELEATTASIMLGIGLTSISITLLKNKE